MDLKLQLLPSRTFLFIYHLRGARTLRSAIAQPMWFELYSCLLHLSPACTSALLSTSIWSRTKVFALKVNPEECKGNDRASRIPL